MTDVVAWHFASTTLRDGSPLPEAGVTLPEIADPAPCSRGYHGSVRAIDALQYAPGPWVARVSLGGTVVSHGNPANKHSASLRTGLTGYVDATETLRTFARQCALDVAHLWDCPDVVRKHLETGDETLRNAARNAARAVARNAAGYAAGCAAGYAARHSVTVEVTWNTSMAAHWAAMATRDVAEDKQNTRLESMLTKLLEDA